jgi:hypothetical protein
MNETVSFLLNISIKWKVTVGTAAFYINWFYALLTGVVALLSWGATH